MLYQKTAEKENCGFGLIAHIEGKASHKIVRNAIHGLARMQHRGAILSDGKPAMVVGYYYKNQRVFSVNCRGKWLAFSEQLRGRHAISKPR